MNILIVTASHRLNSQSIRIAKLLKEKYLQNFSSCMIHELAKMKLPMWDTGVWDDEPAWKKILKPLHSDINNADAFIVVTPEWSGMVPPILKNYFLLSGQDIMGHKPALIVSISSGMGGSYPVNELRISSYKNTKICYLPEHIILRKVEELFVGTSKYDNAMSKRIQFGCDLLLHYAKALKTVREQNVSFDDYPFGM